jgi:hypothetical protein
MSGSTFAADLRLPPEYGSTQHLRNVALIPSRPELYGLLAEVFRSGRRSDHIDRRAPAGVGAAGARGQQDRMH